jgi:Domain of unknown function (DUF4149)
MAARISWGQVVYTTLLALWLGSFLTVGAFVVPTLFLSLPSSVVADTAVTLFKLQGLLGFCVLALLLSTLYSQKLPNVRLELTWLVIVLLSACVLQLWIIPELLAQRAQNLKQSIWHLASTCLYVLQTLCVFIVFVRRIRAPLLA